MPPTCRFPTPASTQRAPSACSCTSPTCAQGGGGDGARGASGWPDLGVRLRLGGVSHRPSRSREDHPRAILRSFCDNMKSGWIGRADAAPVSRRGGLSVKLSVTPHGISLEYDFLGILLGGCISGAPRSHRRHLRDRGLARRAGRGESRGQRFFASLTASYHRDRPQIASVGGFTQQMTVLADKPLCHRESGRPTSVSLSRSRQ